MRELGYVVKKCRHSASDGLRPQPGSVCPPVACLSLVQSSTRERTSCPPPPPSGPLHAQCCAPSQPPRARRWQRVGPQPTRSEVQSAVPAAPRLPLVPGTRPSDLVDAVEELRAHIGGSSLMTEGKGARRYGTGCPSGSLVWRWRVSRVEEEPCNAPRPTLRGDNSPHAPRIPWPAAVGRRRRIQRDARRNGRSRGDQR